MRKLAASLVTVAALAMIGAGCGSSIEVWPHAAVNNQVTDMIKSSGGDPKDWIFDNNCANMGNCTATLAPAIAPDEVIATNVYVVKDSRAALTGTDSIEATINRSAARSCVESFTFVGPLLRCLGQEPRRSSENDDLPHRFT